MAQKREMQSSMDPGPGDMGSRNEKPDEECLEKLTRPTDYLELRDLPDEDRREPSVSEVRIEEPHKNLNDPWLLRVIKRGFRDVEEVSLVWTAAGTGFATNRDNLDNQRQTSRFLGPKAAQTRTGAPRSDLTILCVPMLRHGTRQGYEISPAKGNTPISTPRRGTCTHFASVLSSI
jgi:hypothetical protein